MAKQTDYFLEITHDEDSLATFQGSTPFMAIAVGDLLRSASFMPDARPALRLRVIRVEHEIWESSTGISDKLYIYVEAYHLP